MQFGVTGFALLAAAVGLACLAPAAAELPAKLRALDCDKLKPWREWRAIALELGPTHGRVVNLALDLWQSTDFEALVPSLPSESADELEKAGVVGTLHWHSKLESSAGIGAYMAHVVPFWAALLHGGPAAEKWLKKTQDDRGLKESEECLFEVAPYTFLMVQHSLIFAFKRSGNEAMRNQFGSQLIATMEVLMDLPFNTYDFLDLAWNISSLTLAVNLIQGSDVHYESFEEYATLNPVPPPYLPTWSADIPAESPLGSLGSQRRFLQVVGSSSRPVLAGIIHLHDATAWDDWHSLRTAWESMLGPGGTELRASFYFTKIGGLVGCEEETALRRDLRAPFQALKDLLNDARKGGRGLDIAEDFLQRWWIEGRPALRDAEVLLCGEPVWLCPLLDRIADRPMLVRFNMAVLDEFTYGNGMITPELDEWWGLFRTFVARGRAALTSIGTRYSVEQVAYQTGGAVRFPYVPFLGLSMAPRPTLPERPSHETLLFQTNLPPILAFKRVLKLVVAGQPAGGSAVQLVDMNDLPRGVCRTEMGAYESAILLPHNPAPIRLIDLYAQGVILYVPGGPLIHKWVWANRPFGGFDGMPVYRSVPGGSFAKTFSTAPPDGHPPYSGTAYVARWAIHEHVADRRYWLQYTEWEMMPGLERFSGIPDLLAKLQDRRPDRVEVLRATMSSYLQARRAEALAWWRAAVAEAYTVLPA